MKRCSQHGFTLVETMVVVAILGLLAALVSVSVRPQQSAVDVGHRFRALVDEASRDAVRNGALRPDVATALGSRARTQIIAADAGTTFYVQRLVEEPAPSTDATWVTVDAFTLPTSVRATAYSSQVGAFSSVTTATDWTAFAIACFPDGTCERKSVFFESDAGSTSTRQARVAVLPVASPQVIGRWN